MRTLLFVTIMALAATANAEKLIGTINPPERPVPATKLVKGESATIPVGTHAFKMTQEGDLTWIESGSVKVLVDDACHIEPATEKPYKLAKIVCKRTGSVEIPERVTEEMIARIVVQSKDWKEMTRRLDEIGKRLDGMPEEVVKYLEEHPERLAEALLKSGKFASKEYIDARFGEIERQLQEHTGQPVSAPQEPRVVPYRVSPEQGSEVSPPASQPVPPPATKPAPQVQPDPHAHASTDPYADYYKRRRQPTGEPSGQEQQEPFGVIKPEWNWKDRSLGLTLNLGWLPAAGLEFAWYKYFGDEGRFIIRPAFGIGGLGANAQLGDHSRFQPVWNVAVGYSFAPRLEAFVFGEAVGLNPFQPYVFSAPGVMAEWRFSDMIYLGGRVQYVIPTNANGVYPKGNFGVAFNATWRFL